MKYFKRFCSVILLFAAMLLLNGLFRYLLIDDRASYTRIMLHELYHPKQNIDVLFLGSSHCFHSLNPETADNIFEAETFNAGTSLQPLDASYALLKEAGKNNDLKEVYVELYYGITNEIYEARTDLTSVYLVSDYMKHSVNRASFLLNAGSPDHYVNSFILGRRNGEKLFDFPWVFENVTFKRTPFYRTFQYVSGIGEEYLGKGFVGSVISMENSGVYCDYSEPAIADGYISEDSKKYIQKIIDYCKERDIRLTFYTAPMEDLVLSFIGYDSYIRQVNELLEGTDVNYYDFNLCHREVLPLEAADFMDLNHLNKNGADKFTAVFSRFFTGALDESIFYETYEARLASMTDAPVLGLVLLETEKEETDRIRTWEITPALAMPVELEYEITVLSDNLGEIPVQDFSADHLVSVQKDDTGLIRVFARIKGTEATAAKAVMKY